MLEFEVAGPYSVRRKKMPKGKIIDENSLSELWEKVGDVRHEKGIYVFGIRAGKGFTPYYVGKTNNRFENECSNSHKLNVYKTALMFGNGRPVIFFLVQKNETKRINNDKKLRRVERFFIQIAYNKNKDLLNKHGIKGDNWSIKGVINSSQGKPSKASQKFKTLMGL